MMSDVPEPHFDHNDWFTRAYMLFEARSPGDPIDLEYYKYLVAFIDGQAAFVNMLDAERAKVEQLTKEVEQLTKEVERLNLIREAHEEGSLRVGGEWWDAYSILEAVAELEDLRALVGKDIAS